LPSRLKAREDSPRGRYRGGAWGEYVIRITEFRWVKCDSASCDGCEYADSKRGAKCMLIEYKVVFDKARPGGRIDMASKRSST
jgi:hypothetical protein